MSNAVLERTKTVIDRENVMHELLDDIDFISNEGLMEIRVFAGKVLDRECAEYVPHSFDDLSKETRCAIEDAANGVSVGRRMTLDEFRAWNGEIQYADA